MNINLKFFKKIDFHQVTNIGLTRTLNEDYFSTILLEDSIAFIVCDGMGGHSKGEVASKLASDTVVAFLKQHQTKPEFWLLVNAIQKANEVVYSFSQKEEQSFGMGTTIVLTIIKNNKLFYAHVGDSRLYLLRDQEALQLTQDHSYVEELIRNNIISRKEAQTHPRKNEITRAIGIRSSVQPEVCEKPLSLKNNDFILLCTDGLSDMLDESELKKRIFASGTVKEKGIKLIEKANNNGGKDNITVTLLEYKAKSRDLKLKLFFLLLIIILISILIKLLN